MLSKEKITEELVELLMTWRHSGFNVFCGPRIQPGEEEALENLARYIIRASFSQERMTYVPEESKVLYQSKDGQKEKAFDVLEWLAAMLGAAKPCEDGCSHVPNRGEQMVRYYGHYSNVSRGKRKRQDQDGLIPLILEPDGSSKARTGATHLPVGAQTMQYSKSDYLRYNAGDRSGPGILRSRPVRIISSTTQSILLRHRLYDFFKTGHGIYSGVVCPD